MSCLYAALVLLPNSTPQQKFHSLFSAPQKKSELFGYVPITREVLYWFHKATHKHTHMHTHIICVSVETMKHHRHENKYGRLTISTHMARSNNRVSFIQNENKVV